MKVFCGGDESSCEIACESHASHAGEPYSPIQTRSRSDKDVADAKLVRNLAKRRRLYTV